MLVTTYWNISSVSWIFAILIELLFFPLTIMGNPATGEVWTLPPTQKERSGRPLDMLGGTSVRHALLMQNNCWSLSWIFRNYSELPKNAHLLSLFGVPLWTGYQFPTLAQSNPVWAPYGLAQSNPVRAPYGLAPWKFHMGMVQAILYMITQIPYAYL